jgi:hypothetical protein
MGQTGEYFVERALVLSTSFGTPVQGPSSPSYSAEMKRLYWSGKDSPNAVRVDGLPILKAITDVRMCGIRNGHFNLRVSAGFRSGNKIGYVEIDSE